MCKNNGWIYLIVYFIMFPLGFQGAKLLDRWLNDINEQISGMHTFYLWLLVVGILAALFLLVMLLLHRRLGDGGGCLLRKMQRVCESGRCFLWGVCFKFPDAIKMLLF